MKKLVSMAAAAVFVAGLVAGCGKKDEKAQLQDSLKGLQKEAAKTADAAAGDAQKAIDDAKAAAAK